MILIFGFLIFIAVGIGTFVLMTNVFKRADTFDRKRAVKKSVRNEFEHRRWAAEEARKMLKNYEGK